MPNKVPDVSGMSVKDAVASLTLTQLTLRKTSIEPSATVQSGNVKRTAPKAGDDVNVNDPVDLVISSGSRDWLPLAFMGLAALLLVFLGIPLSTGVLLEKLANQDIARGLITFLIAVTAAALFVIMGVSTIVKSDAPDADKEFDRGKQVLTMLVGILGTIVGFYFGTAGNPSQTPLKVSDLTVDKAQAARNQQFSISATVTGGKAPYKYTITFSPALNLDSPIQNKESKDGKIRELITVPASLSQDQDEEYSIEVVDSAGKTETAKGDKKIKVTVNPAGPAAPPKEPEKKEAPKK